MKFLKPLQAFWFFYLKILIPSFAVSVAIAIVMGFSFRNFFIAFLLLSPFFQYMVYEKRNKNEYYFYSLFGWSRLWLWMANIGISIPPYLIFSLWDIS